MTLKWRSPYYHCVYHTRPTPTCTFSPLLCLHLSLSISQTNAWFYNRKHINVVVYNVPVLPSEWARFYKSPIVSSLQLSWMPKRSIIYEVNTVFCEHIILICCCFIYSHLEVFSLKYVTSLTFNFNGNERLNETFGALL